MTSDPTQRPRFDQRRAIFVGLSIGLGMAAAKVVTSTVASEWTQIPRILAGAAVAAVVAVFVALVVSRLFPKVSD